MRDSQEKDYRVHETVSGITMVFLGGEKRLTRIIEIAQELFPDASPDQICVSLSELTEEGNDGEIYIFACQ